MTAIPPESNKGVALAWRAYNWADHPWATPVAALIGPWTPEGGR